MGYRMSSVEDIVRFVQECITLEVPDDGVSFDLETLRGDEIRANPEYGGVRVRLQAHLGRARAALQIDVGFGDVITPAPAELTYPTLLDGSGQPDLRVYPAETIAAEKIEAMIVLDMANTRLKDLWELLTLANRRRFDGAVRSSAVRATFARRKTSTPDETPVALTAAFYEDPSKQAQWNAFLRRGNVDAAPEQFSNVAAELRRFVEPILTALREDDPFHETWPPGGPWSSTA